MADVVRVTQATAEVITQTGGITVRASQAAAEVITVTPGVVVRASQTATEVITQTPGVNIYVTQAALEVISFRYVLYSGTAAMSAGATASTTGNAVRVQGSSLSAGAAVVVNGHLIRRFIGWGSPA